MTWGRNYLGSMSFPPTSTDWFGGVSQV